MALAHAWSEKCSLSGRRLDFHTHHLYILHRSQLTLINYPIRSMPAIQNAHPRPPLNIVEERTWSAFQAPLETEALGIYAS